jgi:hypothetical protein
MVKDHVREVDGEKDSLCSFRGAEEVPDVDYEDEYRLASGPT